MCRNAVQWLRGIVLTARLISKDKPSQEAAFNKLINATRKIMLVLVSFVLYCVINGQYSNTVFCSLNV